MNTGTLYNWNFFFEPITGKYCGLLEVAVDRSRMLWSFNSVKVQWTAVDGHSEGIQLAMAALESGEIAVYCALLDWISDNRAGADFNNQLMVKSVVDLKALAVSGTTVNTIIDKCLLRFNEILKQGAEREELCSAGG